MSGLEYYWFNNNRVDRVTVDFTKQWNIKPDKIIKPDRPKYDINNDTIYWIEKNPNYFKSYNLGKITKDSLFNSSLMILSYRDTDTGSGYTKNYSCSFHKGWRHVEDTIEQEKNRIRNLNPDIIRIEKLHTPPSVNELKIIKKNRKLIAKHKKNNNFEKQLKLLHENANLGDASSQLTLGVLYSNGEQIKTDYKKALVFFKKAANQALMDAYAGIGKIYYEGLGVKKHYLKAYIFYILASHGPSKNNKTYIQNGVMIRDNFLTQDQIELANKAFQYCIEKKFLYCLGPQPK